MTFGSFIGFAAAFGLSIKVIFGFQHLMVDGVMNHDTVNPDGPSALMYAWMGPFIGAVIRPVGGWLADKFGGASVTQICAVTMVPSAIGIAYCMQAAYASATPEEFFVPFLLLFLVIFVASGIGNGSTSRTISVVFSKEQSGPALGWTSAIGAYGAFIIPLVLGEQLQIPACSASTSASRWPYGACCFVGTIPWRLTTANPGSGTGVNIWCWVWVTALSVIPRVT
jgi:NNP family nitrate/nitrite transporter-like MFS transporter